MKGWTKLMITVEKVSVDSMKELVASQADQNAKKFISKNTALHIAAELESADCV